MTAKTSKKPAPKTPATKKAAQAQAPAAKPPPAAAAPEKKAKPERRATVAGTAKALILAGKTNEEVFAVLHKQFALGDDKKSYPGWYRAALVREEKKRNGAKAAEALHLKLAKTARATT